MRYLYALILVLCPFLYAVAQPYIIKGTVKDTLNIAPLHRSSVLLIRTTDSVIETFTRAAPDGSFELKAPAQGKYILQVSFPSFADFVDVIKVNSPVTNVGEIAMVSREHLLKEFVITKQVAAIKIKGDTTEYMADSFKVKESANVEDLLKKLPGIQVDKNGNITAQGEKVQKVLVDGEEFFSDDPKVVTQGLQANAVEKVQVYDKKSDQADFTGIEDGEKAKTINLELKENKKKGYFGKADVGGGNNGYFQNQAMLNAFKGKRQISAFGIVSNTDKVGLGWSDNDKFGGGNGLTEISDDGTWNMVGGSYDEFGGWSGKYTGAGLPKAWTGGLHFANKWNQDKDHLSGNYRYAQQTVEIDGNNTKQYSLAGDTTRVNTEDKHQFNRGERHGIDVLYDWKIDSNTSIRLISNAGTKLSDNATIYHTETLERTDADGPRTINDRRLTGNTNAQFINSSLLFRRKFAKKGRTISLDLKENYNETAGDGFLNGTTSIPGVGGPVVISSIDQEKISSSTKVALSGKAIYTEPLSKKTSLEFSYGLTTNNSTSLNSSYNKPYGSDKYSELQDSFSSNYKYNILSNTGGANFKYSFKKVNFSFGSEVANASYLQTDMLHGDTSHRYNYVNLFPRANFTYKIARQSSVSFNYQGNTKQPTISQVQPLNQNTDPLNLTIGNPEIKQEFNNRFSLNFNDYKILTHRYIYGNMSFTTTADAISTSQVITGAVSRLQYVNVDGNYSGNGYAGYGFKIKKLDLDMNINLSSNINHVNNFINGEKNVSNNNSYSIEPNVSYEKEDKFSFNIAPEVTYNVNTASISRYSTTYWELSGRAEGDVQLPKKFSIGSSAQFMVRQQTIVFTGNNQVIRWNAYVSKKLLKGDKLEIKAAIYDILNQNTGYMRSAQGSTLSQDSYNTIRRYAMLSLLWNITHTPGVQAETK